MWVVCFYRYFPLLMNYPRDHQFYESVSPVVAKSMKPPMKSGIARHLSVPTRPSALSFWLFNSLFFLDGCWHVWAVFHNHAELTVISKFLLCLLLVMLLIRELGDQLPSNILIAVLFCLTGDVLLQPLDLNYADMSGIRPNQFIVGVVCFCFAYGHLARYFLDLNPDWRNDIKNKPAPCCFNVVMTLIVLGWMTFYNQAPVYLLVVLWIYSLIVVGMATLSMYLYGKVGLWPFLALVAGTNALVFSDTVIGLTVFVKIAMPWLANPVWILTAYILGIALVFNATIFIEKRMSIVNKSDDFH